MCCCDYDQILDKMNPTFLYTWKGTRLTDEKQYHSHDFIEVAFILSGHGKYRIESSYCDVEAGDVLIFNPGCRHQALVSDPANPTTEFFVGFTDVCFPELPKNRLPLPNRAGAVPVCHVTEELRQKFFKLCTSMSAENDVSRKGRYVMLKSYLMQMLILLYREESEPVKSAAGCYAESASKTCVAEQMMNYIEDHYDEKLSLDRIAESMYLSPFYISRIFKSETGDTPIHHLINIRLEKAKELLESGWSESIQEIAARVGYDDAYHFSKLFKKKYGIPPSQVRKA